MTARYRAFCFTHNNYPNTELEDNVDCRYIVYGKEIAPSTSTLHLQGFIYFSNAKTLSSVIKLLPGCHVEQMKGTIEQAIEYCKKEGDYTERGTKPLTQEEKGQGEKLRWDLAFRAAQEGRFEDIPEEIRLRYDQNIKRVRRDHLDTQPLQQTDLIHEWYYGETGTGKSRKAREDNPTAYIKMCNKWWDGYQEEEVVIIDDLDKKHDVLCHHLKIWGDRYPFRAEVKGGSKMIRPKKIIVTSNYHPEEIWTAQSDLEPILRRFKTIKFSLF